jgi:hypothetical protein
MARISPRRWTVSAALVLVAFASSYASDAVTLVTCAPGYPGSTEQAQPTMDDFSAHAARVAGWSETGLGAVYFNDLEEGLARIEQADVALVMVPLPLYLEYGDRLGLRPLLEAVMAEDPPRTWTLVTGKGKVAGPASLDGWEITGRGGFSTTFVRNVALEGWGALPETADVTFSARAVSDLRKASRGEQVAVLLDGEQSAALDGLPFAAELDRVYESGPFPPSLLCAVGERLAADKIDGLTEGLIGMSKKKAGRETLSQLRMSRFEPVDDAEIKRIRELWQRNAGS